MMKSQLTADGLAKIPDRFRDPELLAKGRVQTISLEAVRERLDRRWAVRGDAVIEFVHKQFRKDFQSYDTIFQAAETEFMLLQPMADRFTAEARAMSLLREVLQYFLGSSAAADLKVFTVSEIGTDGIVQAPVSAERLEAVANSSTSGVESAEAEGGEESAFTAKLIEHDSKSKPVTVCGDDKFKVLFSTHPIWSVQKGVIVSHVLKPAVFVYDADDSECAADASAFSLKDRIRVDVLILSEAARLLTSGAKGVRFGLYVPIHQATLLSNSGRQAMISRLDQLGPVAQTLAVDVHGFEAGAPAFRIAQAAASLQGKCLGVSVRAAHLDVDVSLWRGLKLSAVSVDVNEGELGGVELQRKLHDFAALAKGVAPALVAYSIPSRARMLMARAEGFTHLSGERLSEQTHGALTPIRYGMADLYADAVA